MSHYFVAQIKITDDVEYSKYIAQVDSVFKKFKGEYISVDNHPEVLEGKWDYTRTVIIRFNTKEDFNAWYHSPEYQSIINHRLKGAQCDTILVKGLEK